MALYKIPADPVNSAAQYLQYELPDEVLLTIFSYLKEKDLCRIAQVCKRFANISNDCKLWYGVFPQIFYYNNSKFSL